MTTTPVSSPDVSARARWKYGMDIVLCVVVAYVVGPTALVMSFRSPADGFDIFVVLLVVVATMWQFTKGALQSMRFWRGKPTPADIAEEQRRIAPASWRDVVAVFGLAALLIVWAFRVYIPGVSSEASFGDYALGFLLVVAIVVTIREILKVLKRYWSARSGEKAERPL